MGLLFILASCGESKREIDYIQDQGEVNWSTVVAEPRWFKVPRRFRPTEPLELVPAHPFFDLSPYISYPDRLVSFVVVTKVREPIHFEFDVVSGKRYGSHRYCKQKDIWEKYEEKVYLPPYTEGVLPRVLDELGGPQKIRVFGRENFYTSDHGVAAHRVRVVGGVIEQLCDQPPCRQSGAWKSRMVLLAVDPVDPKYKEVVDFAGLKKVVDWPYAKAFMENGRGYNFVGKKYIPAYRIVGEVKPGFALRFSTSFSHAFTAKELVDVRDNCLKLYDYTWKTLWPARQQEVLKKYSEQETQKSRVLFVIANEKNEKIKDIHDESQKDKEDQESEKAETDKVLTAKTPSSFGQAFKEYYQRFGREFQTCTNFVAPSNISSDPERHWFFAHLVGLFRMERLSVSYSCVNHSWLSEVYHGTKSKRRSLFDHLDSCDDKALDHAIRSVTGAMSSLRANRKEHYRYVEYDTGAMGSHEKIYSWTPQQNLAFHCDDSIQPRGDSLRTIFPADITWDSFVKRTPPPKTAKQGPGLRP